MPIIDIFLSGTQKKNRGHLASIVKIAKANGKLNRDEITLLKKIKTELNISDLAFRTIIREPELYPMHPPSNYDERIERLYALSNVLLIDKESYDLSLILLEKLAVGLGFPIKTHVKVVEAAVQLSKEKASFEVFSEGIKRANEVAKE